LLTEKELQVLLFRQDGMLQTEIAKRLNISQSAVSRFEANARAKVQDALTDLEVLRRLGVKHGIEPTAVEERVRRWTK